MANGVNKVILIGNLGQDPEVRVLESGDSVANVSIATSESWKDKTTGQKQERTEWHRVVFFGRLAEIVGKYLRKGSKVYVEGRLRTRKWQDNSGADRYSTEIVVSMGGTMQMLDAAPGGQQQQARPEPSPHEQAKADGYQPTGNAAAPGGGFDDDIPF